MAKLCRSLIHVPATDRKFGKGGFIAAWDLDSPWLSGNRESGDRLTAAEDQEAFISKKRRQIWYKRANVCCENRGKEGSEVGFWWNGYTDGSAQIILLNSPLVPLYIRLTIFILSLLALSLAGSIFHLSRRHDFTQKPSTIMAIVVDAIALVYLVYVTWDEYSGKPLGLRSPKAKMRLSKCYTVHKYGRIYANYIFSHVRSFICSF